MSLQDEASRYRTDQTSASTEAADERRRVQRAYADLYRDTDAALRARGHAPAPVFQRVSRHARTWTGRSKTQSVEHLLSSECWRIQTGADGAEVVIELARAGYRNQSDAQRGLVQAPSMSTVEELREHVVRFLASLR